MQVVLSGEVSNEMFDKLVEALSGAEVGSNISLLLHSDGGSAAAAVAIIEYMRLLRAHSSLTIDVLAIGSCQSAATLILAHGDRRRLSKETIVMVHEDSTDGFSGKVHEAETFVQHLRNAENQWNRLLAAKTNVLAEDWSVINKQDTYLTPEQCLAMGLIDEIV